MSPRKPVKSLFLISLEDLIKHLIKYINRNTLKLNFFNDFDKASAQFLDQCKTGREVLDDYFIGTLRYIHYHHIITKNNTTFSRWQILDKFLHDSSLQNSTRIGGFLLLFDPLQTNISFGHFPEMLFPLMSSIVSLLSNLSCLNLRGLWLHGEPLNKLVKKIPNMTQLTQLIVPYIADDALISAVGRHCTRMELLDISGTDQVTDEGVKKLYKINVGGELWPTDLTETLKYFLIGGPAGKRLECSSVSRILIKVPNLVSIGSYLQTGEAVLEVCKN